MAVEEKAIKVEQVVTAETRSEVKRYHEIFYLAGRFIYLTAGACGFAGALAWTFSIPCSTAWLMAVVAALCIMYTVLFQFPQKLKFSIPVLLAVSAVLLFLFRRDAALGLKNLYNIYALQINQYYNSHVPLIAVEDVSARAQLVGLYPFLLLFVGILALGVVYYLDAKITALVLLIPVAMALAVGKVPTLAACILLIICLIGVFFLQNTRHHDSLYQNAIFVQMGNKALAKLRSQTAVIAALFVLVAGAVSLSFIGPAINRGYDKTDGLRESLQNGDFVDDLRDFWKKLTRGEWDWLPFDIIRSSGVHGGKLSNVKEVRSYGELHLYLDLSSDVIAPFYIRGYVGSNYTGVGWAEQTPEQKAAAAAANESVADLSVRYYSLLQSLGTRQLAPVYGRVRFVITNISANDRYSYIPYGTNLEEFAPSEAYDTYTEEITDEHVMDLYYLNTQKLSNLEAVENLGREDESDQAYRIFARQNYLQLPAEGLEQFYNEYRGIHFDSMADAVKFVRESLAAHAEYTMIPGALPKGKDFVDYFLYENKKGYCTHFATAGTLLFRLAGIPARYVEGYLTTELTAEGGANRIMDDRAHAWVEIYVDGAGWVPVEVTPGFVNEDDMLDDRDANLSHDRLDDVEQPTPPDMETQAPEETTAPPPPTEEEKPAPEPTTPDRGDDSGNSGKPTQPQEPDEQQEPEDSEDRQMSPELRSFLSILWKVLLILLILALILAAVLLILRARYRKFREEQNRKLEGEPREAIRYVMSQVDRISSDEGLVLDEGTNREEAAAMYPFIEEEKIGWFQSLSLEAGFSSHPFDNETRDEAATFYRRFAKGVLGKYKSWKQRYLRYIRFYL